MPAPYNIKMEGCYIMRRQEKIKDMQYAIHALEYRAVCGCYGRASLEENKNYIALQRIYTEVCDGKRITPQIQKAFARAELWLSNDITCGGYC